jgi:hypothetical protein
VAKLIDLGDVFSNIHIDPDKVEAVYIRKTYTTPKDNYRVVVQGVSRAEWSSKNFWTELDGAEAILQQTVRFLNESK